MLTQLKKNPEIDVIKRIVAEGSIRRAMALGLDERYFSDITAANAFNKIKEFSSRQTTQGKTPTLQYLCDMVPTFPNDGNVPERTLAELIEIVRTGALDRSMRSLVSDLDKLLTDFRSPEHAFTHAISEIKRLTRVSGVLPNHLTMDVGEACSMLREEYESKRKGTELTGIPCPWQPLNDAYGGLEPGTLHVVYAPSKHGKTWFSLEMGAVHPYIHAHARVLVISCEMPINQMYRRMMARFSEVDYHGVVNGSLNATQQERYMATIGMHEQEQEDAKFDIGDGGHRCIRVIRPSSRTGAGVESIRNAVDLFEPDILLVDAVYRLAGKNGARDYKWNAIQENIAALKDLSGEKNMPVLVTAQANRTGWKSVEDVDFDDYGDMSMSAGFIQEADAVYRLQKFSLPDHSERILVTIPALRDAKVSPFTIRFEPCTDFSLDCDFVTKDYLTGLLSGTPVYELGYDNSGIDASPPSFHTNTKGIFN